MCISFVKPQEKAKVGRGSPHHGKSGIPKDPPLWILRYKRRMERVAHRTGSSVIGIKDKWKREGNHRVATVARMPTPTAPPRVDLRGGFICISWPLGQLGTNREKKRTKRKRNDGREQPIDLE